MRMIPGAPKVTDEQAEEAQIALKRTETIINSMTRDERKHPEMIKASRKLRIAKGSGTDPKEVTKLLEGFSQMQSQMKMMKNNPMAMNAMMGNNFHK
jgi:signal recognition particle subunit SRP54